MSNCYAKTIIIGSGPAGCTAAIYAARAGLQPIMITGLEAGGQLITTTDVENYPGFRAPIQGPFLMEEMIAQATNVGTRIIRGTVDSVNFETHALKIHIGKQEYVGDTIIVATGASAKWLDIKSEHEFRGHGVSACATCDGFFFRNKEVCVVGGGNTAVEEALYLARLAKNVVLVHRKNQLRAEKVLQDRLFATPNIRIIWDSVVCDIIGTQDPHKTVTGIILKNIITDQISAVDINGVFIAIGHKPNSDLFRKYIDIDDHGYIITKPGSTATNVAGVFAAGDVQDKIFRQAVTAAGTGCMAALEAEKYINSVHN